MKKQFLQRILAISLVVIGTVIYQLSYSNVMAQNQIEPTNTIITDITETLEQITCTPSPTTFLPNLEVIKEYKLTDDINANGSIDPGDKIMYTITLSNKGTNDVTDLVIRDNPPVGYFEVIKKEDISKEGSFNGELIVWRIHLLSTGSENSLSYSVTIKRDLASGNIEISNPVAVLTEGILLAEARSIFTVIVPTLTPSPSPSSTPPPTLTQTLGTVTVTSTSISPGASTLTASPLPTWIIFIMAIIGIAVFTYVSISARFSSKQTDEAERRFLENHLSVFREGVIIVFIVSAVLLMGISNILPSDGVISILSAIVGYVFGRAKT